jgi:hypothetical protein
MTFAVPEHYGCRCAAEHKHPHGEPCPDDYTPHPEHPEVFIEYLFDTEAEAQQYIRDTRGEALERWISKHK